ncbi:MAG: TM2 domain-containing protein, partial [Planctomycetota bacterium]
MSDDQLRTDSTQTPQPRFDPQTGQPLGGQPMGQPVGQPLGQPGPVQGQPINYAMPVSMQGMNLPHQQIMWFEANKKSMAVAYLLNIFVGWIGVHRFYVGRTGSGLALCLVGGIGFLLTCIYIGILALLVACV